MTNSIARTLFVVWLATAARAAELPANRWTKLDEKQSGKRWNAAVLWLDDQKKVLFIGGELMEEKGQSKPPQLQTFDPATGVWEKRAVELDKKLARYVFWNGYAVDSTNHRLYAIVPAEEWQDMKLIALDYTTGKAEELKPKGTPFALLSPIWQSDYEHNKLVGASLILDPVDRDLLLTGGFAGGASRGTLGMWAYSIEKNEWRPLKFADVALPSRDKIAALRNRFYASDDRVDAAAIAREEDDYWRQNEAACAKADAPCPRLGAAAAYDPVRNVVLLFGGDHGDYLLGDTWEFDPKKSSWRLLQPKVSPKPSVGGSMVWLPKSRKLAFVAGNTYLPKLRYQHFTEPAPPDVWTFDPNKNIWEAIATPPTNNVPAFALSNPVVATPDDTLVALSVAGSEWKDVMVGSTWALHVDAAKTGAALTGRGYNESANHARFYRGSAAAIYNPLWYDGAARGKPAEVTEWLAHLPTNEWIEVPQALRPAPERSWATWLFDAERDQMYYWSGGHCADPSDAVHHYHPAINRWSIGYIAGGFEQPAGKGTLFSGRPDCLNHTYKNYALDPVSKMIVAPHQAGTHVYDPDRRDWVKFTTDQPFIYETYTTKCVATPKGVVCWAKDFFGIFDVKTMKWSALLVNGTMPPLGADDQVGLTWDSKRGVLYINCAKEYSKPDGPMWKYDLATGEIAQLNPKNRDTIGDKLFTWRESVYLPGVDLVLYGMAWLDGREVAYNCANNRYVMLNIPKTSRTLTNDPAKGWVISEPKKSETVGTVSFSPVFDPKRNLLWAVSDYKAIFVMRLDPKTLLAPGHPTN